MLDTSIGLGDWLLAQAGVTDTQAEVIRQVQEALRRLPEPACGLVASYGFDVRDRRGQCAFENWPSACEVIDRAWDRRRSNRT